MKTEWHDKSIHGKAKNAIGDMVLAMLLDTEAETKRLCPVDTGRLRASYTHNFHKEKVSGEMGTHVKYAPYVEFSTIHTKPQPHIRPAFEKVKAKYAMKLR